MTIRAALIINNFGRPRVTKFYSPLPTDRQQALIRLIFQLVSKRDNNKVCSFLDAPELTPLLPPPVDSAWSQRNAPKESSIPEKETDPWVSVPQASPQSRRWHADDELRVIYRQYATLYFVFVVDQSESELGVLDLIQVFVEALDSCFENVCELDLIFHFDQVHAILDQIIQGGLVLETNLKEIVSSAQAVKQARKKNSITTDAGSAIADMAMQVQANPQALVNSISNISLSSIAERGSDALGALQWLGNQYWGNTWNR
ncbi:Sigma-adaptin 3A [Malassezia cuniculi]|uniref:Sigma-adaptin 3A n=1 Tax=Malassezia cuniculi TaxID=948313 RepID=A0AAF0ERE4_9BASI|nr:Sigma-adaptin 3A [Malassezia cuniculi]